MYKGKTYIGEISKINPKRATVLLKVNGIENKALIPYEMLTLIT